eukprot:313196_1
MTTTKDETPYDVGLPSKIIDQIYLGTSYHAWNDKILQQLNITHVVCCISGSSITDPNSNIKRLMIPMDDRGYSNLSEKINKAFPFITNAIKNKNNNVLIHCKSAVNRSPTITVSFLMYYNKINLKQAHNIVKTNHELICCHHNYMDQLREYDQQLYGIYSTKPDELETTKSMMAKLRQQLFEDNNTKEEKIFDKDEKENDNLPSVIIDQIYLGTHTQAVDDKILKQLKITHIICCMSGNATVNKNIKLMIPMDDRGYSIVKNELEKAYPFILDALKDKNNNILFHCRSSVNRSPTMVVAMLMKYKNWTLKEAHTLVSEKHSLTCTHYKYMEQLRQYDKELFGKYSTKIGELDTNKSVIEKVRQKLKNQKVMTQ